MNQNEIDENEPIEITCAVKTIVKQIKRGFAINIKYDYDGSDSDSDNDSVYSNEQEDIEEWRNIDNHGKYMISSHGRFKNYYTDRIIKSTINIQITRKYNV